MKIKAILALLFAAGLTYVLNRPLGPLPALGQFFSPFVGFWQNAEKPVGEASSQLKLQGLKGQVTVLYDDNRVPHIFADNDEDLYFAQGYVLAQDRLWQMDFYSRVAAGRLSEALGPVVLEFDKYNRRLQLPEGAQAIMENAQKDPTSKMIVDAYTAGVNAYISQLTYKNYAIEYKLLGYKPEPWTPLKTALVEQVMRKDMNGRSDDYRMSNTLAKYGSAVMDDLFPNYPSEASPIMPTGTKWNFAPLAVPKVAEVMKNAIAANLNIEAENPGIGSNNWAVHGSRTVTGLPLLASDPHLGLTLPSIWYQMQLSSPTVNVYGVCVPGWPGIGIGFNKDAAWGITNVGSDVFDLYQIKFKDKTQKEYWYNNAWKPTTTRINEFKVKGLPEPVKDTLVLTHHGTVLYSEGQKPFNTEIPTGHAVRWSGTMVGNSVLALYKGNRAKNYVEYRDFVKNLEAPGFNIVFASNQNDVAITSQGRYPLRPKGQGKYILDGSNPANDWNGYVPFDQVPSVLNPPRGFVSSANQFPADQTYPYYLGWKFAPSERAIRINERLTQIKKATVDSLRLLQGDNFSVEARRVLPSLLKILEQNATTKASPAYTILSKWNYRNDPNEMGATIFERYIVELKAAIWNDEFPTDDNAAPMAQPTRDRMWVMMQKQPTAKWFDNVNTKDKVETMADIVNATFGATIDSLTVKHGKMNPETWAWGVAKGTDVKHLVPVLKAFSRQDVNCGGGGSIVNATTEAGHGPSWRMVVQTDKIWPKAYGLYPGGQSGSPGSAFYDNMIDKWAKGELNELVFLKSKDEKHPKIVSTLVISR
jgi:penicillin G amidase